MCELDIWFFVAMAVYTFFVSGVSIAIYEESQRKRRIRERSVRAKKQMKYLENDKVAKKMREEIELMEDAKAIMDELENDRERKN